MLADQPREHAARVREQRVEVEDARLEHLLAGEREQLAGQVRRALAGPADLRDVLADRVVRRELGEGHVAVAEDRRQQVVEVVGDASGELADALHLLGLAELLFELPALGDVHDGALDDDLAGLLVGEQGGALEGPGGASRPCARPRIS